MKYLLIVMLLTGCDAQPLIVASPEYKIDNLKFYKGKHDICYAMYGAGGGTVMTSVPCAKVGL